MNSATLEAPTVTPFAVTMADVIARLGDIPPSRILWHPLPGTATVEDLLQHKYVELIDGTLVGKAMVAPSSVVNLLLSHFLLNFILMHNLGRLAGPDLIVSFGGDQKRLPDLSYYSWARWPRNADAPNIMTITPDLAVEVLSDGNTPAEMKRKRKEYFAGGVRLVWMVDPKKRTVMVYTGEHEFTKLTDADTLSGGEVLPGFSVDVAALFQHTTPSEQP